MYQTIHPESCLFSFRKIICTGSKHPENVIFKFENKIKGVDTKEVTAVIHELCLSSLLRGLKAADSIVSSVAV